MGLDPSIFMQGAQLRAQNDAQTRATISGFFDKLAATKQKQIDLEKAKATDYEGSAMRVLQAKAQGVAPDPDDLVRAKAYGEFTSMQNAIDPVTGNIYPKNRNIFETMGTAPSTANYESPYAPPQGINPNAAMPPMPSGQSGVVNDLGFDMLPVGDNYGGVSQLNPTQRDMARGVVAPMGASPKTMQAAQEAGIDLQKDAQKSDLAITEAYGKEKATKKAETESQLGSMSDFIGGIDALINSPNFNDLPSGMIESGIAKATNLAGKPSKQALAGADFDAKYPVLLSQAKTIIRSKGEGAFTDADQALLEKMLPKDYDSKDVKLTKLKAVKEEMQRLSDARGARQSGDPIDAELRKRGLIK